MAKPCRLRMSIKAATRWIANKTIWEEISDGLDTIIVGRYEMPSRAYFGRFNFKGGDQQKRIGDLSGGERNRVHLAKLLKVAAMFCYWTSQPMI